MSRNLTMKWNGLYRFWTILCCIAGTIWCLGLLAILAVYSFGVGLISNYLMLVETRVIEAAISLIINLLVNGLIFLILSYATVSALNKYNNRTGLVRIYLQMFAAAVSHICKIIFLRDFLTVVIPSYPQLQLYNISAVYVVYLALFIIRMVILFASVPYFYKRKVKQRRR